MAKKGYTPEQIINKLRKAEILLNQRTTIAVVSKRIGVSDQYHSTSTIIIPQVFKDLIAHRASLLPALLGLKKALVT